ncbi:MAG: hypothetical protein A3E37_00575 [Candidatus Andersenbacteria bacterium RIFCSPHIGHO2_12_FULL_46_9]|nr:MAG: hypothetical protein UW94_C0001G0036 [Parcubacteria group bacterium GW2011_GWA2_45_14]OGY35094.1 MAG: hypothetical protein A3B76_04590 [Candidatus Andersenbacteria bacterium RIFCSPHIGHO2_02_FULL_46_16]OGY36490.1 MAG: hypothetical protein A3E37_00575 [Candidatus Andersenbacteria bacterium RIFCSPHIGHO2_12_FULL_46_9]HBE90439.1 hypothetical protein [Candidatus Andersenbacteria bacterium]
MSGTASQSLNSYTTLRKSNAWFFLMIMSFGLVLRLLVAEYGTFVSDMEFFISWGDLLQRQGSAGFFDAGWSDRLPGGILYLLWGLGEISNQWPDISQTLLYKLPAHIADVVLAGLLYWQVGRRSGETKGIIAGCLYFFNPFTWYISSLWGQMDAVQGLLLVAVLLMAYYRRTGTSAFLLALATQFKPHSVVLLPLVLVLLWREKRKDFIRQIILFGSVFLGSIWLLALPFLLNEQRETRGLLVEPWQLMQGQAGVAASRFPFASVNAFNFWVVVRSNWQPDSLMWLGVTYRTWGTLLFIGYAALVTFCLWRRKASLPAVFLAGSLLSLAAFTLLTRAHERHIFPFFVLFAFVLFDFDHRITLPAYVMLSLSSLINGLFSYAMFYGGRFYSMPEAMISFMALLPVLMCIIGLGLMAQQRIKQEV